MSKPKQRQTKTKPAGAGGKRKGAGRKPKYDGTPLVQLSVRVREDTLEIIHDQAAAGNISRGEWLDRLILRGWCEPRQSLDASDQAAARK